MITFMLGVSLFALVGVSMLICVAIDRIFRSPIPPAPPVRQFPQPGQYIRLLDNTLLFVQDGGEKDPYIIAANKEVEAICSR